ncbi:MAG: DNA polymerase III subunit delta [Salinivirgaceae bacterium]|jgi:DNA polymerase-3 subunit delta'|nr:DNA polymerase III subunit delta [Salinivirgaceae bacterium]
MNFSKIIGQNNIKNHLIQTVKQGRISHAQLFLGNEGYGSLPLALAYAKYIMCLNKTDTDSCGECSSCRKIAKYQHPDLHFVFPVITPKNKDKAVSDTYITEWRQFLLSTPYGTYNNWLNGLDAGNSQAIIRVDEGKEILRKLNMKSFESDYKIMILWFPEKMNAETANKLLKLIEEPPEKTLFFLVAQNSQYIISTILSRTQLVKITRITEDDLFIGLQEKHQLTEDKARQISRLSEGDYAIAEEYIESSIDMQQNFEQFVQMMRLSYSGKMIDLIKWVDEISKIGREKQKAFLTYSLRMIRENLIINQKQKAMVRMSDNEEGFAEKFARFIHPVNAPHLNSEIDKAILHITRNANAKVVFLDLCIRLNRILKMQ